MVKHRWAGAVLVAGLVVPLAACTDDGTQAPAESGAEPSETAASTDDVVETLDLVTGGTDVEAGVHPLVRSGENVVLTIDLTTDAPERVLPLDLFDGEVSGEFVQGGAIRLADLESKQVFLPGIDAEGDGVGAGEDLQALDSDGLRVQRVYAAPDAAVESLGVLLPGGYLDTIPVVDGEVPGPEMPDAPAGDETEAAAATDVSAVSEAPVLPLESYTAELDGAVQTLETTEEVAVNLGSDVLFDSSSATLRPDADPVLDAAVRRLESHEPGTIEVVGHTDDVGGDASNQKLSQRRAQAVADALAERIDTSEYPLETSGQGETEPLVPNDSDANKQRNRRVALTLASQVTTATEVEAAGELPPFEDGPTGKGPEGVLIDEGARTWRYSVEEARRVGDSLVIDLQVTAEDDEVDSAFGPGLLSGVWSYRGLDTAFPDHILGLTVLSGSSAVYPYDYKVGERDSGTEVWNTLGELDTLRRVDGGQTATFTAVYPAVEGADTITVQVNQNLGATPFRLTDIPVVD